MVVAYCDTYDVQSELQRVTITDISKPTLAEVAAWCDEISIEMEAIFGACGVPLPIVDDEPLSIAMQIAVLGVCARVLRSIEMQNERAKWYQDLYDAKLKLVRQFPSMLGVSGSAEPSAPAAYDSGLTADERHFRRESQDW